MYYHDANQTVFGGELPETRKKTNFNRIKAMGVEELAKFIHAARCCSLYGDDCGYPFCHSMNGELCKGLQKNECKEEIDWLLQSSEK